MQYENFCHLVGRVSRRRQIDTMIKNDDKYLGMECVESFRKKLGLSLRYLVKQAGITDIFLGEKLSITETSIQNWKTGKNIMCERSARMLMDILKHYGINPVLEVYRLTQKLLTERIEKDIIQEQSKGVEQYAESGCK